MATDTVMLTDACAHDDHARCRGWGLDKETYYFATFRDCECPCHKGGQ